jgi:N-formylglutamate amidohydrolase
MSSDEPELPDISTGTFVNEVARHMEHAGLALFWVCGCVSRTIVNFNAFPETAFVGNGQQVFEGFHCTVANYISAIRSLYDFALLIDIHGFRSEAADRARKHDIILGTRNGATLPLYGGHGLSRWRFYSKLQVSGWSVYPKGLNKEDIFWGGYIVHFHASVADNVFAVQLEISSSVRTDRGRREKLAKDFSDLLIETAQEA